MVLVAKMTHIFCTLQYHVYIYISPRGEQHFFRSVEQVGNDLMSAGFHREASDIFFGLSGYLGLPLGKDSGDRNF